MSKLFPTLRMAHTLNVAVSRKINVEGYPVTTVKVAGKKIGTTVEYPHADVVEIPAPAVAEFVKGFRDLGYKNTHPELFPNPTDELTLLSICAALLKEGIRLKPIKRRCKTNIIFVMKGADPNDCIEVTAPFTPEMKARVIRQNPPGTTIDYFVNDDIADL